MKIGLCHKDWVIEIQPMSIGTQMYYNSYITDSRLANITEVEGMTSCTYVEGTTV